MNIYVEVVFYLKDHNYFLSAQPDRSQVFAASCKLVSVHSNFIDMAPFSFRKVGDIVSERMGGLFSPAACSFHL